MDWEGVRPLPPEGVSSCWLLPEWDARRGRCTGGKLDTLACKFSFSSEILHGLIPSFKLFKLLLTLTFSWHFCILTLSNIFLEIFKSKKVF